MNSYFTPSFILAMYQQCYNLYIILWISFSLPLRFPPCSRWCHLFSYASAISSFSYLLRKKEQARFELGSPGRRARYLQTTAPSLFQEILSNFQEVLCTCHIECPCHFSVTLLSQSLWKPCNWNSSNSGVWIQTLDLLKMKLPFYHRAILFAHFFHFLFEINLTFSLVLETCCKYLQQILLY